MHVRRNAVEGEVARCPGVAVELEIVVAGRNREECAENSDSLAASDDAGAVGPLDGLLGEIETDLGAVALDAAVAMVVNLHQDIRILGKKIASAFGQKIGSDAWGPAAEAALARDAD